MTQLSSDSPAPDRPAVDPLPVHFLTIVLNGQPFIQHHIEQMKRLPFEWHWHIVEGVAALRHDTGWSLKDGGEIPAEMISNGLSSDGTTQYLNALAAQWPTRVSVYRKAAGAAWDGKREMVSAPLDHLKTECLLWEIDVDELWTAQQFAAGRQLFLDNPTKTAAFYWCWFYVGPRMVISTRGGYANNPATEWLRTWRFKPGMQWASHEPPLLAEQFAPDQWRDVARVDPLLHAQTEAAGLVFQHFAYATQKQLEFKERYYGYNRAVLRWRALQAERHLPVPLVLYYPWVKDATMVTRADELVPNPLAQFPELSPAIGWNGQPSQIPRPRIAIDGAFFQGYFGGIGRFWTELLRLWIANGFAKHLIWLDRVGSAPDVPGLQRYLMPPLNYAEVEFDRRLLQETCDFLQIDLFTSTYYTSPISTPSVFVLHDMIPEVMRWDPESQWQMKHASIRHASAIVSVSHSSKRDLLHFFPEIPPERITVAHNAANAEFRPRSMDDVVAFRQRCGLTKPYFLIVGTHTPYKNKGLIFRALQLLRDAANFDILCTAGCKLEPELAELVPPGCTVRSQSFDDADLSLAYSGAVALLHPSVYEGFGMPILEAMCCACPVITCNNSSLPEVAGDAAMYVSATDPTELAAAMLAVLDVPRRTQMIERGLARSKHFSWSTTASTIQSVLLASATQKTGIAR